MTSSINYDDIYNRIDELVAREKQLRAEIAAIRLERTELKSQLNFSNLDNPRWASELPEEFWYPSYYASKVINDMAPNMDYKNTPPDIHDWIRNSSTKDIIINLALGIGIAIIAMQVFFFIL